ncbi:MAG: gamma carbonic anhydrase family protein [Bdellovibrionales bacterium]
MPSFFCVTAKSMTNQAIILPFQGVYPQIDPTAYIAPGVTIIGDVVVGPESSIWPACALRGDLAPIRIGAKCNIQDGTIIHVTHEIQGGAGTHLGDNVTIGHMALLHDCDVGDGGFIGMRATMLDRSIVEAGGMLAAGALLTQRKVVKTGEIWAGNPAKYWRDIKPEEARAFLARADEYAALAKKYM